MQGKSEYEEESVLGKGGFGRAVLVRRKSDGKLLVVKEVDLKVVASKTNESRTQRRLLEMAQNEAALMEKVEHANIVRVYGSFHENEIFHIVMEYCDGGTLKEAIHQQVECGTHFDEMKIRSWVGQLANCLHDLHQKNILHRDIKSENAFFVADGWVVKLGDFGIAKDVSNTTAGFTGIMTYTSSSPESLSEGIYTESSEVWALGVLAYELCALKLPFKYEGIIGRFIYAVTTLNPKPVSDEYSIELRQLIDKMMSKAAADRPSMKEISNNLKKKLPSSVNKAAESISSAQLQNAPNNAIDNAKDDSAHGLVPEHPPPPPPLPPSRTMMSPKKQDHADEQQSPKLPPTHDHSGSPEQNDSPTSKTGDSNSSLIPSVNDAIKIVIVGDGAVGKACMAYTYTTGKFPEEYVPIVFENDIRANVQIGKKEYKISILLTAGQDDYDNFRPLSYPGTDVFLVCFAIDEPSSYENVTEKWIPEIKIHCPQTPFVLVGLKTDLRNDANTMRRLEKRKEKPVTRKMGAELAKMLNALGYVECSSLNRTGLENVFIQTVLSIKKDKCVIM